jgi:hypothetical protein
MGWTNVAIQIGEPKGYAIDVTLRTLILPVALVAACLAGPSAAGSTSEPGTKLWVGRYNGPGNDFDQATAIAPSPDGSTVFVTGYISGIASLDYATIAYDAGTGRRLWIGRYDGPGNGFDQGTSIAADPLGRSVFVTGSSVGTNGSEDYATIAYDPATGTRQWVGRYDGSGNDVDRATFLTISPDGSTVFVTGFSDDATGSFDYATIAYGAATGTRRWISRYSGPGDATASSIATSPDGSKVFVTGSSVDLAGSAEYASIAYDAATGTRRWISRYSGPGDEPASATSIAAGADGSKVFVTGYSYLNGSTDYATVAYQTSSGARLWSRRYDGPANYYDFAYSIATSPDGSSVFVTGSSAANATGSDDYATIAYDVATGSRLWTRRYNGPANDNDVAYSVAASPDRSNVFVTGFATDATGSDFGTIAYDAATGKQRWIRRYSGPDIDYERASAIAVSPDGSRVFVDGTSGFDYATLAYEA